MGNITTHDEYFAYFKDIAEHQKEILHTDNEPAFTQVDMEQLLAFKRGKLKTTMLLVEYPSGGFKDNRSDNIQDKKQGAFTVYVHVPSKGAAGVDEFTLRNSALDKSLRVGDSICSKIRYDAKTRTGNLPPFIDSLDIDSIHYDKMPPQDDCHGYRFTFIIGDEKDLSYKPSEWTY